MTDIDPIKHKKLIELLRVCHKILGRQVLYDSGEHFELVMEIEQALKSVSKPQHIDKNMTPRERILRLETAIQTNNPDKRFVVFKGVGSVCIKLDGWDVASLDPSNLGYNTTQLRLAETLLGLSVDSE